MAPRDEEHVVNTTLSVEHVKQIFHGHVSERSRRAVFEPLLPDPDPFGEVPTFAAVASAKGFGGGWAVQILIADRGPVRDVGLRVIGTGLFDTVVFVGLRDAYLLRKGRPIAQGVLDRLRSAGPVREGPWRAGRPA